MPDCLQQPFQAVLVAARPLQAFQAFQERLHGLFQGVLRLLSLQQVVPFQRCQVLKSGQVNSGVEQPEFVYCPVVLVLGGLVGAAAGAVFFGIGGDDYSVVDGFGFQSLFR